MGHWHSKKHAVDPNWDTNQLLPHVVLLGPREWYTLHRSSSTMAETRVGEDCGGSMDLHPVLRMRIQSGGVISRYVVQRRARKQLFTGNFDSNDQPVFAEFKQAYHPTGLRPYEFGRIGVQYDIAISFATKAEAMAFRLILSGVI